MNRGPLGPLAGKPLNDQRVRVDVANVADILNSSSAQFDVVILDVDNGPAAFTAERTPLLHSRRNHRYPPRSQSRRRSGCSGPLARTPHLCSASATPASQPRPITCAAIQTIVALATPSTSATNPSLTIRLHESRWNVRSRNIVYGGREPYSILAIACCCALKSCDW